MIDLDKQRETVHNAVNTLFDIAKVQKAEIDMLNVDIANKQAEIDSLKAQLAKVESGEFVVVPVRELKVILSCVSPDDMNLYEGVYEASEVIEKAMIEAAQENSHE